MNKEFIKKMVKAKRLEYEAIKEIMPDNIKKRVDSFEIEAINVLKDIALELIKDDAKNTGSSREDNKNIKKINIDFN